MTVTLVTHAPNAVLDALRELEGIDLRVVESFDDPVGALAALPADGMLLTYRCPRLIPAEIHRAYPLGAFNLHPSLLPDHPGPNPWPRILAARRGAGVTLHRLTDRADSGEILAQAPFDLDPSDTLDTARCKADLAAARLILAHLSNK